MKWEWFFHSNAPLRYFSSQLDRKFDCKFGVLLEAATIPMKERNQFIKRTVLTQKTLYEILKVRRLYRWFLNYEKIRQRVKYIEYLRVHIRKHDPRKYFLGKMRVTYMKIPLYILTWKVLMEKLMKWRFEQIWLHLN